jgi:hypothetical protein
VLRRTSFDPGPPAESTFIGEERKAVIRKLWKLKQRDGAELAAVLFYDSSLGEATLEVTARTSFAEDMKVAEIGEQLRQVLVAEGAKPMEEVEAS